MQNGNSKMKKKNLKSIKNKRNYNKIKVKMKFLIKYNKPMNNKKENNKKIHNKKIRIIIKLSRKVKKMMKF